MSVITVLGEVDENKIGIVAPHEHLILDISKKVVAEASKFGKTHIFDEKVSIKNLGELRLNAIACQDNLVFSNIDLAIKEVLKFKKYGGNTITIELCAVKNTLVVLIKDNGNGIHKSQKDKVFEQFYRIPTGNTHNIKGFGIGLYYTKNIIEKHGGTIDIKYDKNNNTLFKIELVNE